MDEYMGIIKMFAGNFAPRGWMFCAGQLLSISNYTALFSILGTTYGGDGRTNFALPDLRTRVPVGGGMGPSPGLPYVELGEKSGEVTHTLIATEIPAHNHSVSVSSTQSSVSTPTNGNTIATPGAMNGRTFTPTLGFAAASPDTVLNPATIGVTGGSQPHNNMQPYLGVCYIICIEGIFPPRS